MTALVVRSVHAIAVHRRFSAILAILITVMFGSQIRSPQFDGSLSDEIGRINPQLQAAAEVRQARGTNETMVVMLDPGTASIGSAFAALQELEAALPGTEVRSPLSLRSQLFLFGLDDDDAMTELLDALRGNADAALFIGRDNTMFAASIIVERDEEEAVLGRLQRLRLPGELAIVDVLSAKELELDVVSGLQQDLRRLIPGIVFVMVGALLIAFGRWRSAILPAVASIASSVIVFAVLSIAGIGINLVTLLALPIVLIVALANSCHFLSKASRVLVDEDIDRAVVYTMERVGVPYLVSCLTTAVALGSLGFNEIAPIRQLGLVSATSLVVAFFVVLLFAPLALGWHLGRSGRKPSRLFYWGSEKLREHRRITCGVLVIAAALSVAALPGIEVRSDARIFFPDDAPFTEAFATFEDNFYVFAPLRVLVRDRRGDAGSVEALQLAGRVRDELVENADVRSATVTAAVDGGGFLLTIISSSEAVATDLVPGLRDRARENSENFELLLSSAQLDYESIDNQALESLGESLMLSLGIILGVIILVFRSTRIFFASVIANAIPLLIVFGVIWLAGDPLNLVTAWVFLVALGVIVDDTIHILYRHRYGGGISGSSIEYSVVLSTGMLCLGLLLCLLSDFPTTRQFALYCAVALAGAVISDLSLLPALLKRRDSQP